MSKHTRHNLFSAATQVVTEIVDTNPPDAPADVARLIELRHSGPAHAYRTACHRYVARHEIVVGLGHAIIGGWPVPEPVRTPKGAGFGYFGWWAK